MTAADLTQAQLLAHIAHLTAVGSLPPPEEVRFAPHEVRRQVHITCESDAEARQWGEWIGADDTSTTSVTSWIACDWHGWVTAVWVEPAAPIPMTPATVAACLLES